jgi:hypothetical protein
MYSHLLCSLFLAVVLCCSEDEFFDEDFFEEWWPPVICLWHGVLFRCLDLLVL